MDGIMDGWMTEYMNGLCMDIITQTINFPYPLSNLTHKRSKI